VPPSRRRPIPTPPAGGRPKVAGLNRRVTAEPETAPVAEPQVAPVVEPEVAPEPAVEELKAPEPVEWEPAAPEQEPVADEPAEEAEPAEKDEPVAAPAPARRDAWLLPVALLVVAVLLGGLGTFFLFKSRAVSYDAALVDTGTTSEVNGQVREAVEKSFSYNFADVAATEKAAKELLTGRALCQYNAVFGPVKEVAPQQKLVVTVRVVSSAVSSLKDGRATVLVFADQVTTRTTDNQSGGGTAMLRVSAVSDHDRWKIDNMEMFGATAEQNQQLRNC
jgi:Mce-associated membrane protein